MSEKEIKNFKIRPFQNLPYLENAFELHPKTKGGKRNNGGNIISWEDGYLTSSEGKNGKIYYFDRLGKIPEKVVEYYNYFKL